MPGKINCHLLAGPPEKARDFRTREEICLLFTDACSYICYQISRNGTDNKVAKRTYRATMMNIHHLQNPFTVS